MWRKVAVAVVSLLTLAGCSASDFGIQKADPGRKCADLFVKTYTTDGTTVGVWDCLSSEKQQLFHTYAKDGDVALSGVASVHHMRFVIHDPNSPGNGYVYAIWEADSSGKSTLGTYMVVFVDAKGKVAGWTLAQ